MLAYCANILILISIVVNFCHLKCLRITDPILNDNVLKFNFTTARYHLFFPNLRKGATNLYLNTTALESLLPYEYCGYLFLFTCYVMIMNLIALVCLLSLDLIKMATYFYFLMIFVCVLCLCTAYYGVYFIALYVFITYGYILSMIVIATDTHLFRSQCRLYGKSIIVSFYSYEYFDVTVVSNWVCYLILHTYKIHNAPYTVNKTNSDLSEQLLLLYDG